MLDREPMAIWVPLRRGEDQGFAIIPEPAMLLLFLVITGFFRTGLGGHGASNPQRTVQLRESEVVSPSEMYALGDAPIRQWPNGWFIGESCYEPAYFWSRSSLVKLQHQARFNMLMVDAHVETVRTNELFSPEPRYRRRWNNDNQAPGGSL